MSYYAVPRMTRDIDLVVALNAADAPRIEAAFAPDYYVPDTLAEAIAAPEMFNLVHYASVVKIDVVVRKQDVYRRHEFDRRRRIRLGTFEAWLVSPEDLLLSKLLWAQQSGSEQQLRDVDNLLASGVDRAYLTEWAPRLGVETLLRSRMS